MILTEKQHKYRHYHQLKLINMNILQVKKYYFLIKAMFTYISLLVKHLKNKLKTIEVQGEKRIKELEEQKELLVKFCGKKDYLTLLKQKEIY